MKKFVMGLVVGVGLTIAVSASAEGIQSLIGKQVEGQVAVIVDGKEISVPAAIIDGTSYAPVRAVGEAVGRNVGWEEGKVILNSSEEAKTVDSTRQERSLKLKSISDQIKEIEKQNEPYAVLIMQYEGTMPEFRKNTEEEYNDAKKKLDENIKKLNELRAQQKELLGI